MGNQSPIVSGSRPSPILRLHVLESIPQAVKDDKFEDCAQFLIIAPWSFAHWRNRRKNRQIGKLRCGKSDAVELEGQIGSSEIGGDLDAAVSSDAGDQVAPTAADKCPAPLESVLCRVGGGEADQRICAAQRDGCDSGRRRIRFWHRIQQKRMVDAAVSSSAYDLARIVDPTRFGERPTRPCRVEQGVEINQRIANRDEGVVHSQV